MASPHAMAMDVVNAIPGCSVDRCSVESNTVISMRVMGWGPSLHRTGLAWAATPIEMTPEAMAAAVQPYVDVQRRRIASAAGLGFDRQPANDNLSHMVVDRHLLRHDERVVSDAKATPHRLVTCSLGGLKTTYSRFGISIHEGPAEDPRPRLTVEHMFGEAFADLVYDGISLYVGRTVPEAAVGSLIGMRVGDVVTGDPAGGRDADDLLRAIAGRVITAAMSQGDGTRLEFEGEWVPIPA